MANKRPHKSGRPKFRTSSIVQTHGKARHRPRTECTASEYKRAASIIAANK